MRFGEYLVAHTFVDQAAVDRALQAQRYRRERLGRTLEGLDALSAADLDRALQAYIGETGAMAPGEALGLSAPTLALPEGLLGEGALLRQGPGGLVVLTSKVRDAYLRRLEEALGAPVSVRIVSGDVLAQVARQSSGVSQSLPGLPSSLTTSDAVRLSGGAYAAVYRDAVAAAHQLKASDIHFLPTAGGLEIIFRIFGAMGEPWIRLGIEHRQGFINELKRLTNMAIAVSGKAQDARVSYPRMQLELRASLVPTHYGEKVVMRLLDQRRSFSMEALDIDAEAKDDFQASLKAKSGVVLISGPTGSGKTTTLYTAVSSLDRKRLNIVTIEDPVEYTMPGITQIGVSSKLSFGGALRAILRQDPDVILVGEIRDEETANLCFKAASTGHLVLSTIHANSSVEVIQRLLGLGVERYLLASCLRFSVAQRVVGRLCPACSMPAPGQAGAGRRVAGLGCDQCRNGLVGLVPIFEYMDRPQLEAYAVDGFAVPARPKVSLLEAFERKAEEGLIDIRGKDEVA